MSGILKWATSEGSFKRQVSSFRNFISKSSEKFKPEAGRYHLYVSLACPWVLLVIVNVVDVDRHIGL
jgi:putative glutathione S-transferase